MIGVVSHSLGTELTSDRLGLAAQILEEHHLVAWSRSLAHRERFGLEVAGYLRCMSQSQTCVVYGGQVHDLETLCRQIERAVPGSGPLRRSIVGRGGVIDRLRRRPSESPIRGEADIVKRRFYVWRDADVLLRAEPHLFSEVVDAIAGVAAEAEYTSDDRLVIHRAVFVGGPALDMYADDERGQFQRWLADAGEEPWWRTLTGVAAPPVMRYAIA